jgi:hypothetical protein
VRIEGNATLPVGADVIVTLNGLPPQPGLIRWREETSYGITFNRVIALSDLVAWLQEQRERPCAASGSLA